MCFAQWLGIIHNIVLFIHVTFPQNFLLLFFGVVTVLQVEVSTQNGNDVSIICCSAYAVPLLSFSLDSLLQQCLLAVRSSFPFSVTSADAVAAA